MMKQLAFVAFAVTSVLGFALGVSTAGAGLVGHWTFDTDYNDASGNGAHGTAFDGNGDGDTDGVSITNTAGEYKFGGGAADFLEERDYVDIPKHTIYSGNEYSIAFWARRDGTTWDMVIGQPDNSNYFIGFWSGTSQKLRWRGANSNTERQADFATGVGTAAWHHYVVVAEDADSDSSVDDVTLYVDGAFVATDPDKLTGFVFDAIGDAYTESSNFSMGGQVDEVWLFDEAIDAVTVSNLYTNNTMVPEPNAFSLIGLAGLLVFGTCRIKRDEFAQSFL